MLPARSRRWFAGAVALAAVTPLLAVAREEEPAPNAYVSPEFGMDVAWQAPWALGGTIEAADDIGTETILLEPPASIASYLSLSTILISHGHSSSTAFLDGREQALADSKEYRSRSAFDGVHELIHERTESTLTVLFFLNAGYGPILELYEYHAEPDAEFATESVLMVNTARRFVGHFESAQKVVTLNGASPFTATDDDLVIQLANEALYPDGDIPPPSDPDGTGTSYTSPEFGMEVRWEDPWELDNMWDDARFGSETVFLNPAGSEDDQIHLSTVLIREVLNGSFDSPEHYLDHYEESHAPSNASSITISRVDLIQERTESTVTVLYIQEARTGMSIEFFEYHVLPDAEYATETVLRVKRVEAFEEVFIDVQEGVTLNGEAPFLTVDNDRVIRLVNDALATLGPEALDRVRAVGRRSPWLMP